MLKIENLKKTFENQRFQLEDISFHLPKGYLMGLIGENGVGKSTILKCLLGLYKPEQGNIWIDGMDLREQEREAKDLMGFVVEQDVFPLSWRVEKSAKTFGKYYSSYEHSSFLRYCQRFRVNQRLTYKELSKGEKMKFQFAFALAHHPRLLVLDEPTANFDPEFRREFLKELAAFMEDGEHSVLLATHLMEDVEQLGDYVTYVKNGKLLFSLDQEQLENRFRMVYGESYLLDLLPKEAVLYREKHLLGEKALVRHRKRYEYQKELEVQIPGLNELFYCLEKGGVSAC